MAETVVGWLLLLAGIIVTLWAPQHRRSKAVWVFVFMVLGGANVLLTLRAREEPRVSIVHNEPLNSADPFTAPFVIKNDGEFAITKVRPLCRPNIRYDGIDIKQNSKAGSTMSFVDSNREVIVRIDPGKEDTAFCVANVFKQFPVRSADVTFLVSFKSQFYGWFEKQYTKDAHFVTAHTGDGTLVWIARTAQ